jgi:hypothetical protein
MEDTLSWGAIFGGVAVQFVPVWIALVVTFALSITFKRRLGLYGKLFDSPVGMIGFGIVMFWVFTALFADQIITHDPLAQFSGMKNKPPGTPLAGAAEGDYAWFLFGGDHLARDVFSRMVMGARSVLSIARPPRCSPSWSGSRWACRPATSAAAWTRRCPSSPIWCWPSRSSCCSTSSSRPKSG